MGSPAPQARGARHSTLRRCAWPWRRLRGAVARSPAPQGFSECHSTFRAARSVLVRPRLWVGSAYGLCALASWCPCVVAFSFFFLGGCARGLGFPCCPVPWPCLPAGYFMACSMWWLKRSPSFSLIVCSIVSRCAGMEGQPRLCQRSGRCRCSWLYAVLL